MIFQDYKIIKFKINLNFFNQNIIKNIFFIFILLISTKIFCEEDFIVKKIQVEGLKRISIQETLKNISFYLGDSLSNFKMDTLIKKNFFIRNFDDVKIFKDENLNTLIFRLKEKPLIHNIFFVGNDSLKNYIIQKNLIFFHIMRGEPLSLKNIHFFKKQMENLYFDIGKFNIKIKFSFIFLNTNVVNIKINIYEGSFLKIKKINIVGNRSFSLKSIVPHFQLKDDTYFWNILKKRRFERNKLLQDVMYLHNYYYNRGFLKFRLLSKQISITPDRKHIYVTFNVDEGKKYIVSSIIFNSNKRNHVSEIKKLSILKKGDKYSQEKVINLENQIRFILGKYGYARPIIKIKLEVDEDKKLVNLVIDIDSGIIFYVRKIIIKGNKNSCDTVLRRELEQLEYSRYNSYLIEIGKEKINRTGYFEYVNVKIKNSKEFDKIDLVYYVKERNTGSFNFGVGYGNNGGINFQISANQDNWIGSGKNIGFTAIRNSHRNYIEISFTSPYITSNGISFNNRIFYSNLKKQNELMVNYTNKSYGNESIFSIPINLYNTLRLGAGYVKNNFSDINFQVAKKNVYKKQNDMTLNYGWTFSNLNKPLFPTLGNNISFDGKITLPGSNNHFYKIILENQNYFPLNKKHTWVLFNHNKLGYGKGISSNKELPFYESFYAYGFNSVRGFHNNTIGPKTTYTKKTQRCIDDICSSEVLGGNFMAMSSLEIILPTPLLKSYSDFIRTSLFIDAGILINTNWNTKNKLILNSNHLKFFNKNSNIRVSIGASLQWISPFGPIVFSYSKPIKVYPEDVLERFQFNVGKTW